MVKSTVTSIWKLCLPLMCGARGHLTCIICSVHKLGRFLVSSIEDYMAMQTQILFNNFMSHSWDHIWSMVAMCGILTYQRRYLLKMWKNSLVKINCFCSLGCKLQFAGAFQTIVTDLARMQVTCYIIYSVGCSILSTDCGLSQQYCNILQPWAAL